MARGSSDRGNGHGGRSLGRGFEGGPGGHSFGRGSEGVRGGHSLGRGTESGRGGRPLGFTSGDGCALGGLIGRTFGEGRGRGIENRRQTNSSAAPVTAATATPPLIAPVDQPPPMAPVDQPPESRPAPTLVAGTNLGDQVATSSDDASSSNSKPLLKITHKSFSPSHMASGQITKCIKQCLDKEGYTWSKVTKQTKEYYWNEFQKHFSFHRDLSVVRSTWERQAAIRYSGTLCEWRKSERCPLCVPQGTWDNWQQQWNTPEFKNKCMKASQNRLSEVAGPGNGPSKHCGGSRSAIDHSIHLAKMLGHPVTDYDVFLRMHQKSNGEFVDKRSKDVAEEVMTCYNAATQNQTDNGENASTVDLSEVYYEVVGPLKKQRVYGLGCKPSSAANSFSKSASSDRNQLRAELYEEMREDMKQRQEEIEKQMRERQEQIELEWRQKQQEMEDFMQRFMRTAGQSYVPPTDPHPSEDDYAENYELDE